MAMTIETLMSITQEEIPERALTLEQEDIKMLVEWLSLKENDIRYQAFLLLQAKSRVDVSLYSYWDTFRSKLKSDNSYQRSLGVMLIAENVKWDTDGKMQTTLPEYLDILQDEKPITIRQCIQALKTIVSVESKYNEEIAKALLSYDIMAVKETMRKLILLDILSVLIEIRKTHDESGIGAYIYEALMGEILDTKSKKTIEKQL